MKVARQSSCPVRLLGSWGSGWAAASCIRADQGRITKLDRRPPPTRHGSPWARLQPLTGEPRAGEPPHWLRHARAGSSVHPLWSPWAPAGVQLPGCLSVVGSEATLGTTAPETAQDGRSGLRDVAELGNSVCGSVWAVLVASWYSWQPSDARRSCLCRGMAGGFGLDDEDLDEFLASSSSAEEAVPAPLQAAQPLSLLKYVAATVFKGPREGPSGDASRPVPASRCASGRESARLLVRPLCGAGLAGSSGSGSAPCCSGLAQALAVLAPDTAHRSNICSLAAPCAAPDPSRACHRWDADTGWHELGLNKRFGSFVEDADRFDAGFYSLAQPEAAAMDAQQRLLLEASWEALQHAGPTTLTGAGPRSAQAWSAVCEAAAERAA